MPVLLVCWMFPFLIAQCAITFVLAAIGIHAQFSFRTLTTGVILTAVGCSAAFGFSAYQSWKLFAAAQAEHPQVSLADRFADHEIRPTRNDPEESVDMAGRVEYRLEAFEESRPVTHRGGVLRRLHNATAMDFALAPSFGVSRMPSLGVDQIHDLDLAEVAPIPLGSITEYRPATAAATTADGPQLPADSLAPGELQTLHSAGVDTFVDPDSLGGYWLDREHATGFLPHQFRKAPSTGIEDQWRVTRLELISLLRHATPVAYVSKNLPSMNELKHAPTRPLTAFESGSLADLQTDEDIVFREDPNRIQMVGAVRASSDCMGCHDVPRGYLLGAFSYDIERVHPLPEPLAEDPRVSGGTKRGHILAVHRQGR
ncbi:hypothetical protein [Lignipirellula cremea]|uniref:hypothetical protein n=1 Tax=Lignipirellula cremea TaxID=2528010 RepID=UPI00119EBA3D|nr:hypothetical protein [Lignipirellula cremea]